MCVSVSTAPVPVASAKTQQTDRHVSKAVKSSEPDSEKLTLMTVKHSTVADVKTTGRDHAATLTSSDLRSNYRLFCTFYAPHPL